MARPRDRASSDAAGGDARRALRRGPSGCVAPGRAPPRRACRRRRRASRSNILRGDYAGSARCAACHAEIYRGLAELADAPHDAAAGGRARSARAPFDGADVPLQGRHARGSSRSDGARFVELTSAQRRRPPLSRHARHRRALPRGLRRRRGRRRAGDTARERELLLPVSYVFETRELPSQGLLGAGRRSGPGCARAASGTRPASSATTRSRTSTTSVGRARAGPGAPGYQGEVVDRLLPRERRWRFEVGADGERALARRGRRRGRGRRRDAAARRRRPARGARRAASASCARASRRATSSRSASAARPATAAAASTSHDPRVLPDFAPRSAFLSARPEAARRRGDARRAGQPRLRALPPGAVLALPVHLGGRAAARRQARAAARSPRARRATSCSAAARARCRA